METAETHPADALGFGKPNDEPGKQPAGFPANKHGDFVPPSGPPVAVATSPEPEEPAKPEPHTQPVIPDVSFVPKPDEVQSATPETA